MTADGHDGRIQGEMRMCRSQQGKDRLIVEESQAHRPAPYPEHRSNIVDVA